MLRLEAETIWECRDGRLGAPTVAATLLTYDGRVETLLGDADLSDRTDLETSICRSWLLTGCPMPPIPKALELHTRPADLRPPARWDDAEWRDLISGTRGPWAALTSAGRVVSLAHCARLTDAAAEVGVQTEGDMRGHGLAGIVVGAWLEQVSGSGRRLFYSASEEDPASHRVATKLEAVPLGRIVRTFAAHWPGGAA